MDEILTVAVSYFALNFFAEFQTHGRITMPPYQTMLRSVSLIPQGKVLWKNEALRFFCSYSHRTTIWCGVRSVVPILPSGSFPNEISSEALTRIERCAIVSSHKYFFNPVFIPRMHSCSEILAFRCGRRKFSSAASSSSRTFSKENTSLSVLKPSLCIGNVNPTPVNSGDAALREERTGLTIFPTEPFSTSHVFTKKQLQQFIKDIMILSKSRLSAWVVFSTLPGYFLVLSPPPISIFCCFAIGTYLSSACAATLNQMYERKQDTIMLRTKNRPLASGRLSLSTAAAFAFLSGSIGVGSLFLSTSLTTASISALTIALYACVYTPLKVVSPYNTHVGAIVGALPILMGCAAAGCNLGIPEVWLLFFLQYLWQFPHFYSLAWLYKEDYTSANFKMFPLSDNSGLETAKRCGGYLATIATLPVVSFSSNEQRKGVYPVIASCFGLTSWMAMMSNKKGPTLSSEKSPSADRWNKDNLIETIRARLTFLCPHMFIDGHSDACPHQRLKYSLPVFGLPSWTQQEKAIEFSTKQTASVQDIQSQGEVLSLKEDVK
ncbi:prenyltransferase, UbiA family protein [Cardiosporidium cionae]|uniref:Heme O synthase n=1 Tax=Cardiosporidium cionae TaxID=476202 RepID=A0ABQ7JFI9_9APIC|nr:prenyltransferase, UbiA family protein [Cardiosporidium cionae]|eukprot:KAF8822797.1 prenyltransferase, UbiA family protein [Cardiosporidium cionae]